MAGIGKAGDVAERSPTVYSANVKEAILLQRRLVVLDRSERSAVHRIKVDQKVMYKRFQAMLMRSKLTLARIMKQKDVERDLRAKAIDGLNTYIPGKGDEDYDFLNKLEKRPCTASCYSPRARHPKSSPPRGVVSNILQVSPKVADKKVAGVVRSKTLESMNIDGKLPLRKEQRTGVRPATTIGASRIDDESIGTVQGETILTDRAHTNKNINSSERAVDNDKYASKSPGKYKTLSSSEVNRHTRNEQVMKEGKDMLRSNGININNDTSETNKDIEAFADNLKDIHINKRRRKTVTTFAVTENTPPQSPKQPYSRRASKAAEFFQEEDKIDLVKLRLMEAKSKDYSDNVREFCRELEEMSCSHHKPSSDYYTMRLQTSLRQGLERARLNQPEQPESYQLKAPAEDDDRRSTGNIYVRSLTLPSINWNFRSDGDGRA